MRYFNNKIDLIPKHAKGIFDINKSDKYILKVLNSRSCISFPILVSKDIFDQSFILDYKQHVISDGYKKLEHILTNDHKELLNYFKNVHLSQKMYNWKFMKNKIEKIRKTVELSSIENKDSIFFFERALYSATTGIGAIEYDIAKAISHLCKKEDLRKSIELKTLNQFRFDLIQMIFEYYPKETKRFTYLKSQNKIKNLLIF
jgi:hypothetical protein